MLKVGNILKYKYYSSHFISQKDYKISSVEDKKICVSMGEGCASSIFYIDANAVFENFYTPYERRKIIIEKHFEHRLQ
jgi:hypothetical protein